ncbi:MAG: 3-dehydroquinate dehydratase [Erysipelotrichales bacterium]|nr:3-dehydroquinate dehydratase [Erysipelotrichales bacterium]
MKKILVINGPNLNMLKVRDAKNYGNQTLAEIENLIKNRFKEFNFEFFQSNHEGYIIDKIHEAFKFDALVINPGAFTHTSIAIRDALELLPIIKVEVHLSNLKAREEFRRVNVISDVVDNSFMGKHSESYLEAMEFIRKKLKLL